MELLGFLSDQDLEDDEKETECNSAPGKSVEGREPSL